jgi:hypothetical protein
MMLRTRMILAFSIVVLIPLALLAFGLRHEMTRRLTEEYLARVDSVGSDIQEDLQHQSTDISRRLASLKTALLDDRRFRTAAVAGIDSERDYLLDYAASHRPGDAADRG